MNRSVVDVGGGLLIVSQFTLAADTRAGNRPSFTGAAPAELGRRLYERVVATARRRHHGGRRRVRRRHAGAPRQRRAGDDPADACAAYAQPQSAYWPAALMIGPHLLISASTNFLCSAPPTRASVMMTAPSASSRLMKSGSFSAARNARVELVGHRLRRSLRRVQAVPDRHVEALHPDSSSVGRFFSAGVVSRLRRGHRVGLDLAGLDLPGRVGRLVAHQVDLAADQVGHRRGRALVRNGRHLDLDRALEQQAAQVRRRAEAGVGEVDLALVGLDPARQLGIVVRRQRRRPISVIGTSLIMPRYSKSSSVLYGILRYRPAPC